LAAIELNIYDFNFVVAVAYFNIVLLFDSNFWRIGINYVGLQNKIMQ